jgi:hypothetical protein
MVMSTLRAVPGRTVARQSPRTKLLTVAVAGLLCGAGLLAVPTSAVGISPTTGTWYSYPAQVVHTSVSNTTGTAYKSAVRAPINADGSSNWPGKRGVIPVQFDLLAAPTTVTTTTTTYDPPVWQSLNGVADSWSYAGLNLNPTLTFNDITNLSATYNFTTGDCFGGSLRWDVRGPSLPDGVIHIYYGTPSNALDQGCSGANSGSGQNLITTGITPNRFEIGNTGVYVTYADVLAATHGGTDTVTAAQLTLDSGWSADQRASVSNVRVNDNTWVPKTTSTTSTTVTGSYVNTCSLPAAKLLWAKNDATPTGAVNEAESIQPKDTGVYYRNVDCKYIYNLDVSSLSGQGTYTVWVNINGVNIAVPATFDLR